MFRKDLSVFQITYGTGGNSLIVAASIIEAIAAWAKDTSQLQEFRHCTRLQSWGVTLPAAPEAK